MMFYNLKHIEIYILISEMHYKMVAIEYGMDNIYQLFTGTLKIIAFHYGLWRKIDRGVFFSSHTISNIFKLMYNFEGLYKVPTVEYDLHSIHF